MNFRSILALVLIVAFGFAGTNLYADYCSVCKVDHKSGKCPMVKGKASLDKHCSGCDEPCGIGEMKSGATGNGMINSCDACGVVHASAECPPPEGNVWTTEDGVRYFTCPVMKGEARVEDAAAKTVIDGVTYYHCCPPCQGPFRKDPQKYLKSHVLPGNVIRVDAEGVKFFRDPVNGKVETVSEKTDFYDHLGKRYFFTKNKNMKKFAKSPGEFIDMAMR